MQRKIKSYVLRAGRMSNRQQQALENDSQGDCLCLDKKTWDFQVEFGREAETVVEIGFGMGGSLFTMAKNQPNVNFIGIEVHRAGIGSLLADLQDEKLSNVRIAAFDAVDVFSHCIADNSLAGVQIFFPDPWPKKRHHKRRLVQPQFIRSLVRKIKVNGFIHCATDWEEYALHMLDVLNSELELINQQKSGGFALRPDTRPLTKFENRGQKLGHGVWDLLFERHRSID